MAIDCTDYAALPGSKRCQHYESSGACALPTRFMCVEWEKKQAAKQQQPVQLRVGPDASAQLAAPAATTTAHAPAAPTGAGAPSARSGAAPAATPVSPAQPALPGIAAPAQKVSRAQPTQPAPEAPAIPLQRRSQDHATGFTQASIDDFKAKGISVELDWDGDAWWLVPEYSEARDTTGAPRREVSVDHMAIIAAFVEVFPGCRLVRISRERGSDRAEESK